MHAETIKKPTVIQQSAKGANDRIRVAVLGVNGRGKSHIEEIMAISEKCNVEVAVLCDPDIKILETRAADFEKKYSKKVVTEQDFRRTYEDRTIDAVSIATPNHCHALQTIWACQAGKDSKGSLIHDHATELLEVDNGDLRREAVIK